MFDHLTTGLTAVAAVLEVECMDVVHQASRCWVTHSIVYDDWYITAGGILVDPTFSIDVKEFIYKTTKIAIERIGFLSAFQNSKSKGLSSNTEIRPPLPKRVTQYCLCCQT